VRIDRFDPTSDEARLEACYRLAQSSLPGDDPDAPPFSLRRFRSWAYGSSDDPQQTWLATDGAGAPVGYYMLTLPVRENRTNAFFESGPRGRWPVVAPNRRREGTGTALLVHAAGQAEQAGRSLLIGGTRVGGPGAAFAAACGARPGIQDVRRVLDLDAGVRGKLAGLRAAALKQACGYRLRCWSGPTPDELARQACALYDALEDAPHDAAVEPMAWDAERLRADEQRDTDLGLRWHRVAAFAGSSGEMAALTEVAVDPDTAKWGHQGLTAVTAPHRGRRLGMLIKAAMLEWLAGIEPQLEHVFTYNAAQNAHMIAVNEGLGYRVAGVLQNWEIDVAAALQLAAC
jgi:GNAT superfamily N-acetyltransferase